MIIIKKIALCVLWSIICFPLSLRSQNEQTARAIVFTNSGNGLSGYMNEIRVGRDDDTLILYSANRTDKILVGDLARVVVLPRRQQGNYFLAGALAGTYLSTLLIGQLEAQPTGFLSEDFTPGYGLLATAFLGIAVGGGIGILFKSGSNNELLLDFDKTDGERKSSRKKLYEIFSNEPSFGRIHFSVQGGHVYTRVKDDFQNFIGGSYYGSYGYGFGRQIGKDFNLLRKVQITYSLDPNIEIGGAIQWSSEPSISHFTYANHSTGNNSYSYDDKWYEQSFLVTGYYAIGKYKPFVTELPPRIDIALGCGIGTATIEYHRSANFTSGSSTYVNGVYQNTSTQTSSHNDLNEKSFSAIVFGECSYYLFDYLSLGIIADYSYFPPYTIPADPIANYPEQTLSGNSCIGFVLGVHL